MSAVHYGTGYRDGLLVDAVSLAIDATDVRLSGLLEDRQSDELLSAGCLYLLMESGAVDTDAVQSVFATKCSRRIQRRCDNHVDHIQA